MATAGKVSFTGHVVDLSAHTVDDGQDFYAINPKGNVPCLVGPNGFFLNENVATLTFLADRGTAGLAPKINTPERYVFLNTLAFIATELHKGVGGLFNPTLSEQGKELQKAAALKAITTFVEQFLDNGRKKFLNGETLSAADVYAYIVLTWTAFVGIDLPKESPKAQEYLESMASQDVVKKGQAAITKATSPIKKRGSFLSRLVKKGSSSSTGEGSAASSPAKQ